MITLSILNIQEWYNPYLEVDFTIQVCRGSRVKILTRYVFNDLDYLLTGVAVVKDNNTGFGYFCVS